MDYGSEGSDLKSQCKSFLSEGREDCTHSTAQVGEWERCERGLLVASSLALTWVLKQRGERVPAFVPFASAEGGRKGGRLGEGLCLLPGSRAFVPHSRCEGKLLSQDECACGCGCPHFFHGHAGNQSEAAFLNSRPVIPGNKRAQEGAVQPEWGGFGNSSAGPLLI